MKCFYHSADLDGHCSGAIIKRKYPNCEMIGINYREKFPWDTIKENEEIIMVDFSLQPFSEMERLATHCNLTWIDHHISAIKAYQDSEIKTIYAVLSNQKAACELTYEHYYNTDLPRFIWLLGRYDVWHLTADKDILPFQYGMRLGDTLPTAAIWKNLFDGLILNIIDNGKVILKYQDIENAKYIKAFSFEKIFEGHKAIVINRGSTNSQMFNSVWDESKYDIMITFVYKGNKYTVSLYTTKANIDVSEIAKKYGGGGHKQAAGFQCKELSLHTGVTK